MEDKKNQLIKALLENSALDLYQHILEHYSIHDLFALCYQDQDHRLAFRATWTLEHILLHDHTLLQQHNQKCTQLFHQTENQSSLRSISKIIIKILQQQITLSETEIDNIIQKSFSLLDDSDCPIALMVNCWDILYLLGKKYDWIYQELRLHIQLSLEKNSTPATRSRGIKLLQKLK